MVRSRPLATLLLQVSVVALAQIPSFVKAQQLGLQNAINRLDEHSAPSLNFADLATRSDLIVIAKATGEKHEIPWDDSLVGKSVVNMDHLVCVSNELTVLAILKGEANKTINVLTIDNDPDSKVWDLRYDGFARFAKELRRESPSRTGAITNWSDDTTGSAGEIIFKFEPEYLVFLRKTDENNTYVPAISPRFSELSVFILGN